MVTFAENISNLILYLEIPSAVCSTPKSMGPGKLSLTWEAP
jgi:hypothetical protein